MCVGSFVVHSVSGCHIADSNVAPGVIVRRGLGEGSCWLTCWYMLHRDERESA